MHRSWQRRNTMLLTIVLTGLALARPSSAAAPPLPIDAYWQRVEETRALVNDIGSLSPETQHARLMAAADAWETVTWVRFPDDTIIRVDHGFLVAKLRADPPDLDELDNLLSSLLAARDTWPQREVSGTETDTLDSILARPEFQWQEEQPSPIEEWWRNLRERFWEFVINLLPDEITIALLPLVRYGLVGLAALALILVLVYAMRGVLADFVSEGEINGDDENGAENLTAATALKRAQTLSTSGDYRTAVRYLYLSTLLLLEERGLLRYDRSLTNREYLRTLAHRPELAAVFRNVVEVFDRVWYGYRRLDEATYARYAQQVEELQRQQ